MISIAIFALAQLAAATPSADSLAGATGARNPAYARDDRLALAIHGDIWDRDGVKWLQLTSGTAWDRQPAWMPDGKSIIYTSTADGGRLYRVAPGESAQRVTTNDGEEMEANVAPDGSIAYVKKSASSSKIWIRKPDGTEKRLTRGDNGAEHSPAWSADGSRIAYSAAREDRTRLRVKYVAGDSDRVIVEDRDAEHPAWSPQGDRIVFTTRSGRGTVWVTTPDARYVNFVSPQRAEAAWSPDGSTIALAEIPPTDQGYNGDPNRLGEREVRDDFSATGHLWFIAAPVAPASVVASALPSGDRAKRNTEAMSSFWSRMDSLYFNESSARHARWEAMRATYMQRAQGAANDDALQQLIHSALRDAPTRRDPGVGTMAVSSAHPVATAAGLEILRKGGNVVDAAVAVSFALGVVEPDASGLGGYGQMLVRMDTMPKPQLIEFMTRVPAEASLENGDLSRRTASDGPVVVNVPGTLAGMELAWKKWGSRKVKWADIVAPAIRAAEQGYVVSEGLATTLATEREHFMKYPSSRALFFPKGEALHAGDTLRNPDLARTLRAIADSGAQTFYGGEVGRRMVADLRGQGNAMRTSDLKSYYAAEREPVSGTYRGYTLYSSAPPVAGGATLVAQLNLLEGQNATSVYTEDAASLHAILEAWKLVPSSRGKIADPGLWPVNITAFTSKDTANYRWRCFDPKRALQPNDVRGESLACAKPAAGRRVSAANHDDEQDFSNSARDIATALTVANNDESPCSDHAAYEHDRFCHRSGTTAFTVADAQGNIVSATQTLGTWGGNFYVSPGLGFLYNDKLGSYGTDPDEYGSRLPNARHGSTLAPTIVFRDSKPVMSTAAAGNNWITSAVFSTVVGVLDGKLDAQHAIELPRFTVGQQRGATRPEYEMQIEDGFSPSVIRQLEAMGHRFARISLPGELREGYAATITFGDREVMAGADPRRAGAAGAIGCPKDDGSGCHP